MHITEKGQVTIPAHIREKYKFLPNSEVDFIEEGGKVILKKSDSPIKKLKGLAKGQFTTDEIMRMTRGDERDDTR